MQKACFIMASLHLRVEINRNGITGGKIAQQRTQQEILRLNFGPFVVYIVMVMMDLERTAVQAFLRSECCWFHMHWYCSLMD